MAKRFLQGNGFPENIPRRAEWLYSCEIHRHRDNGVMLEWLAEGRFPLYLAPMAGFTDTVFREICKEYGADVMVTEFVMADALLRDKARERLWETVDFSPGQRPMGVQLFGASPEKIADAARLIRESMKPDFIDLNFGCPAPKVTDQCAGSAILRDLSQLERVVAKAVEAVPDFPVTAKIRIGWDDESIVACEAARVIEDSGARALTVHGRTRKQGYRGEANWQVIAEVAKSVSIPVIGNGDVNSVGKIEQARSDTRVAGVMIGRAALGYPWIFRELKYRIEFGESHEPPSLGERWTVLLRYCDELMKRPASRWNDLKWMRPRLKAFTARMPNGRKLRSLLDSVSTYQELVDLARIHLREHDSDYVSRSNSTEVLSN